MGVVVGATVMLTGPAQAATVSIAAVSITNGSFEDTAGTYSSSGTYMKVNYSGIPGDVIPGWTVTSGDVDWVSSDLWTAQEGSYSIDMNGDVAGTIQATFDTTPGATYFVSFYVSGNPNCGPAIKQGTVQATGGPSQPFSHDGTGEDNSSITWDLQGYGFTATDSSTALAFASSMTTGDTRCGPILDNVTVTRTATTGAECKDGGWATSFPNIVVDEYFKNQGQCVSYFATRGHTPIGS